MGRTCSDHRQPGSSTSRPTTSSPTLTVLADALSSERISSGTDRFFVRAGRVSTRVSPDPRPNTDADTAGRPESFNVPTSAGAAGAHDAVFVGEDRDLHAVAQPESGEDAGDVAFDGRHAEVEPGRDLGVRQP